jgi:penicillin-binding protein 1C
MKAMEQGIITPQQLLPDVPSKFGNFSPNNFSRQYQGAIPANKALCKSLNIPMVYLLREYGLSKFHNDLKRFGFHKMNKNAQHYGLSLILGGGEASSWEINSCFNLLASSTLNFEPKELHFLKNKQPKKFPKYENTACAYSMFNALTEVSRPDEDNNWKAFESAEKIAWKTGTSFGFRDAWAVGITPKFVVSVWVGNADGEGQAGLTGVKAAAPLLFSVFRKLQKSGNWFDPPKKQMVHGEVCAESGNIASRFCPKKTAQLLPRNTLNASACPYHQMIHTNKDKTYRVNSKIMSPNEMTHLSWFILPPLMETYYKASHPEYVPPPNFDPRCFGNSERQMSFIYPKPNTIIHIPKEIDGKQGKSIFEVSHRNQGSTLFWHLDDIFLGTTTEIHQMGIVASRGIHCITVVDQQGNALREDFEVVSE